MCKIKVKIPKEEGTGHLHYLGVLAFPEDQRKAEKFIKAAYAGILKAEVKAGKMRHRDIPPNLKIRNRDITNRINQGLHRIRIWRTFAAYRALAYIFNRHETDDDWKPVKWQTFSSATIMHAADRFSELLYDGSDWQEEPRNAEGIAKRYWASSRPVLHLQFGLMETFSDQDIIVPPTDYIGLITDSKWLDMAIEHAEVWRRIFLPHFFPDIRESDTIKVEKK